MLCAAPTPTATDGSGSSYAGVMRAWAVDPSGVPLGGIDVTSVVLILLAAVSAFLAAADASQPPRRRALEFVFGVAAVVGLIGIVADVEVLQIGGLAVAATCIAFAVTTLWRRRTGD